MTLTTGTRLGSYEILALIGVGGMGEVYRAHDTKLNRDVALKVLPEAFTHDPERLARFRREAQVLASLNHPNIAAIYGLEEVGGALFLVLELVEGETLAARLKAGPLHLTEAVPVARQIADGCQAAHEKGVMHRDLKPANIAFAADGLVKVLDFGLAKAAAPTASANADVTNSPTLSLAATKAGVILGTAAYMSPEQAKGREADKRSDVWAFGCVLYEMLTGKRVFEGEDLSDTLAFVLTKEPNWTALPATVPPSILVLLKGCLERDRRQRITDISTALFVLRDPASLGPAATATPIATVPETRGWQRALPWTLAGALSVGLALALSLWAPWRLATPPGPQRLSVELGADVSLANTALGASAILSRDGQTLAFVAQTSAGAPQQLYVRQLGELKATPLSGTENADSPFFSPDGKWIAFFAGGKLKKISVTGGAAVSLCDASGPRGGTWADDDTIVFQPIGTNGGNLLRVSSSGGKPEPLLTLAEGEATQRWPQVLPGGKAVLFTSHTQTGGSYEEANLVVQPLPTGPRKVLLRGGYHGRYLSSGHLVYMHEGTLFAASFDLDRFELTGQPVPALEGVTTGVNNAAAQFAAAENGTLVYLPGENIGGSAPIAWMDRTGKTTPLRATPADWSNPQFSPGQDKVVFIFNFFDELRRIAPVSR